MGEEKLQASAPLYCFGAFEADVAAGELRCQGRKRSLQAQPWQMLLLLLEHPGVLVTREAIQQRLWPDGTFVDFEHGLNATVNKLRTALGDSAKSPRFIETIAGTGYRWLAPVTHADAQAATDLPVSTAPRPASVIALFLAVQGLFLFLYFFVLLHLRASTEAFAGLTGIGFAAAWQPAAAALVGIPVRLYLSAAALLRAHGLRQQFRVLFPCLLVLDELWAAAPLLAQDHIGIGLALGFCATMVLLPFAQRTLVNMGALAE